ncbi:UNVERIFIED_CONTAM: Homeobox protein BEL1 [Sesamum angustifolium]|uniref:Homeobox protein BEL1 n=1 Tax=Sesamum angustifolium TaxID=2727405 RepID=A0AAW2MJF0_9LAMI
MAGPSIEKPREMIASTGYCYSGASSSHHLVTQLQSFDPNPEIYNMGTAGMGGMIGFPSKTTLHQENGSGLWKGFFGGKPAGNHAGGHHSSSSKEINEPTSNEFHHHDLTTAISDTTNETLMVSPDSSYHHNRLLAEMDPSLRSCVFPCEGTERPSQGLSLSLSSSNPSSIGLQSFEFRQQHEDLRFGPSSSRSVNVQGQQHQSQIVRNSKYLGPAQELLNEFCNLGTKETDKSSSKIKVQKMSGEWQDEDAVKKQSLYSLDLLELQRRKTKLLQMLEEVDKRYKHYCDQMKAVVSSFEAVAGNGAATVYSAMASRAMSKHFRCLRDGILSQIKATKKAMGDKDTSTPGTMKGETPRLRILDQTLRQQRALQQMSMMESHPWRPQRGLPERSVSVLRAWLFEHFLHPTPSQEEFSCNSPCIYSEFYPKLQVSNWFINARVRLWKPMVEEMYLEEQKEEEGIGDDGAANLDDNHHDHHGLTNQNPSRTKDQKPAHDQLVRIDSECLSSIINNTDKNTSKNKSKAAALQNHEQQNHPCSFGRPGGDSYGAMELDFSSYTHHHSSAAGGPTNYVGGGVSLTLGLHQHGGSGGVSLPFSPASVQSSLFYPRDHMEDCQTVQYSLLDSENQNLPYRNLMGAQLLHDLAG